MSGASSSPPPPPRVPAGALSQLQPGEVRVISLTGWVPHLPPKLPIEALLLLDHAGVPRAYLNRCRHLPIPIDGASRDFLTPDKELLECRTHGALYRLEDGMCIEGPCEGLALQQLQVLIEGDALYLIAAL